MVDYIIQNDQGYDIPKLKNQLREEGYVVIPGLVSEENILRCKKSIEAYFDNKSNRYICSNGGKSQSDSFTYVEGIRFLLGDKKLVDTLNQVAGVEMNYLHHCDVHQDRLGSWHKDSSSYIKYQWEKREGAEEYNVFKVAIYLQDHTNDINGLSIREKSHLIDDFTSGKQIDLHSQVGDVIFFDQRLTHCGQQFTFFDKAINTLFNWDQVTRTKVARKARRLFGIGSKISVFYGLGSRNEFSQEFSRNIIKRQNMQNSIDDYAAHPLVVQNLAKSNTPIIDK